MTRRRRAAAGCPPHHWLIESRGGPGAPAPADAEPGKEQRGTCRRCGATRSWPLIPAARRATGREDAALGAPLSEDYAAAAAAFAR